MPVWCALLWLTTTAFFKGYYQNAFPDSDAIAERMIDTTGEIEMSTNTSPIEEPAEVISETELEDRLEKMQAQIDAQLALIRDSAKREIELLPDGLGGDPVEHGDEVVVVLHQIQINSLFCDREREGPLQEGALVLTVNNCRSSVAWKRAGRAPNWSNLLDNTKTVLFAGKLEKFLKLDFGLIESEDPEKLFAQKIADLLNIAAGVTGLVPGYGTAISAGLSLGAAIAELIKATLEDDRELQYMGFLGKPIKDLRYGTYTLMRHPVDRSNPDISITFGIRKLTPPNAGTKNLLIVLDSVDLSKISGLQDDDRVLLEATITASPSVEEKDAGSPLVNAFSFEHPFRSSKKYEAGVGQGQTKVEFWNVVKIDNQVLYDGPWGEIVGFNIGISGIPKDLHEEQWFQVLKQAGEVIKAIVPSEDKPTVSAGFEIAQNAAGFLIKMVPDLRFAMTQTGLFVKKGQGGIECLREIKPEDADWQTCDIEFTHKTYGKAIFHLRVLVTDIPAPPRKLPRRLIYRAEHGHVTDSFKWDGGPGMVTAYGEWISAAGAPLITIQTSPTGKVGSWVAIDPLIAFESDGHATFQYLSPGIHIRAELLNADDDTKLTCVLDAVARDQLLSDILKNL